jgi:hypothetical protein
MLPVGHIGCRAQKHAVLLTVCCCMCCCSAVKASIIPGKTRLVMVESPTNPRMQVTIFKHRQGCRAAQRAHAQLRCTAAGH